MRDTKEKKSNGTKIISLQACDIIRINRDNIDFKLDFETVLPDSLLPKKKLKLKAKQDKSYDFISLNFDYDYHTQRYKELAEEIEVMDKERKSLEKGDPYKKELADKLKELEALRDAEKKPWTVDKLRIKLYTEGFDLTHNIKKDKQRTIHYRYWFRSPSKGRVGNCLFINEEIYDDIIQYQNMYLTLPEGKTKVVEFEAYKSLTASAIERTIEINPKNILVINDLTSFMETDLLSVNVDDGKCVVVPEHGKVSNVLWDGMALLDSRYFLEGDHFYLLRQHMFKACCFKSSVVQFLKDWCKSNGKDYNVHTVKDRYGHNIKVCEIHCITTENACKFEKFSDCGCTDKDGQEITSGKQMFAYWKKIIREYEKCKFGIVKTDHKSKYDDMQRMSYQHCNTLLLDKAQTKELTKTTVDYLNEIKFDDEAFIDYLQKTASRGNINGFLIDMYEQHSKFRNTDYFRESKTKQISDLKKRVESGKLFIDGDNLTVCGNPYLLLLHAVEEIHYHWHEDEKEKFWALNDGVVDPTLPIYDDCIACYTERFDDGEYIAGFRNPHNAPNNLAYMKLYKHELMDKYFDFGNNVLALGCISSEAQSLCNGMDFDSDFVLCTNDKTVLYAAKKVFRKKDFACIVNDILKDNRHWVNNLESIANIDNLLAEGKDQTGETSNLAQKALSYYQHTGNKRALEICVICSVLAQVAIDSSKRMYSVDIKKALSELKKDEALKIEYEKVDKKTGQIKTGKKFLSPLWFDKMQDKKDKKEEPFGCNCTMQYIQECVKESVRRDDRKDLKDPVVKLLRDDIGKSEDEKFAITPDDTEEEQAEKEKAKKAKDEIDYNQKKYIKDCIQNFDNQIIKLNIKKEKHNWKQEQLTEKIQTITQKMSAKVGKRKISDVTMLYLVRQAITKNDKHDNNEIEENQKSSQRKLKDKIMIALYTTNEKQLLGLFKSNKNNAK